MYIGFEVDLKHNSMKLFKNKKDCGYIFEGNVNMKKCTELYPTLQIGKTKARISFLAFER